MTLERGDARERTAGNRRSRSGRGLVTYHSQPITVSRESGPSPIPAGCHFGRWKLGLLFKMGRFDGTLRVRVLDGERIVTNKTVRVSGDPDADVHTPYRLSVFLVANVQAARDAASSTRSDITRIGQFLTAANNNAPSAASAPRTEVVDIESFRSLPTRPDAYDAFDAVLITERFDLDAARNRALQDWVRSGGHLLIAIGRDATNFAKTSPELASWLPVEIEGTTKLRDLSPIESFCRQSSRIMGATDEPLDAAKLKAPGGKEQIPSLAGPLLCRAAYGLGGVTVFGLDLSSPPLANWSAAPDLVQRLFEVDAGQAQHLLSVSNRLTQTGITELATQLDGSLDDFPNVSRFTIWHVMGLLVALVLIVGPLDYLLVHKLLHRPELTWVTLPLIAIVAAGAAFYWSSESKGKQVLLNQLDIFDVDATSGWGRAHSYGLLYSPENRRYDITAQADVPPRVQASSKSVQPPRLGWHGRPEANFGGMYRTAGVEISHPELFRQPGRSRVTAGADRRLVHQESRIGMVARHAGADRQPAREPRPQPSGRIAAAPFPRSDRRLGGCLRAPGVSSAVRCTGPPAAHAARRSLGAADGFAARAERLPDRRDANHGDVAGHSSRRNADRARRLRSAQS